MRRLIAILAAAATFVLTLASCGGSDGSTSGSSSPAVSNSPTTTSSPSWPKPTNAALPKAMVDQLQAQLTSYIAEKKLVGVTASVVTRDGMWAGAAGVDGAGKTLSPDSAMVIASTTKTFTAAEILLLSAQGKINLDAPVTDYVSLPFDAQGATVRQLATMTSGFPDLPEATIRPKVSADLTKEWKCTDVVALVDPKAARKGSLGGAAAYNGLNYYVLGMVIEKVTSKPLADAIRTDLLVPAGVTRVWTQTGDKPEKPSAPLAMPVDDTTNPVVDATSGYLPSAAAATSSCAGAGMAADAPSLARWGYLLYGGYVIDNSLVKTMTTPNPMGGDNSYGFGTMIDSDNGDPLWGHAGNYTQYTSILLVWPKTSTVVSVLVPMTGGTDNDVRGDLAFQLKQTATASN